MATNETIDDTPAPAGLGKAKLAKQTPMDPRVRAAERAKELMGHIGEMDAGNDEFFIDRERMEPPGWTYEWKRFSLLGKEDPSYAVQIRRAGWDPVPVSRHPEMMPTDWPGETIERKGMILCERPTEIQEMVKSRQLKTARDQVRQKEQQLAGAPPGHFERDNKGNPLSNIKKSLEPMPVPKGE